MSASLSPDTTPHGPVVNRVPRGRRPRTPAVIPGAVPAFGLTLVWVGLLVLLPLAALAARPWEDGPAWILHALANRRTLAALRLSFGTALVAAAVCTLLGLLLAWVLERVRPPGWRVLDALVDLPFALPTAVAGITLTTLYAPNGWLGAPLAHLGIHVAYTPVGIMIALVFVGLPFVVRTVLPVLRDLPHELEEAASTLGAKRGQIARRVLLPALLPALATGFGLAFARGVGEYGSVIFIAGNRPLVSEIAPLLIVIRLQEFDYAGAAAIGLVMLLTAALCLLAVTVLRRRLPAMRGVAR
ncbi:sulfate ABC transporter permease subunit CysT [Lichenicola cladoniae]|uniref:Sulfate transport system permease protein CysT n=1 Tax=Lichenicola cladoniae TaxID=1484109 RepID=A0A6M8HSM4_9PROT|nr:sulfate ABC transporter permease subunit CysT [Acetobacteraceae bacterium]QKE91276.1 sulfate ABC transporter permease subunit CysT [Lichenicola cladoniae]